MIVKWFATRVPNTFSAMKAFQVLAVAALSCVSRTICTQVEKASKSDDTVRFKFDGDMLLDFNAYANVPSSPVLQFNMPGNIRVEDFYEWHCESVKVTPEIIKVFNTVFKPKVDALREDLPKYFCQPLLEGDELEIVADLFSDRLEDILDQIRVDAELINANAPVSSLLQVALFMTLPPLRSSGEIYTWYYPQELLPIMRENKKYQKGHRQWREALEKAQREGLKYEGPAPVVIRQPDMTASQPRQENWDMLLDEVVLFVLCKTGSYIRYARLVCKKWRKISTPFAVAGILGYGNALKILSGRATFDKLVVMLDSITQMALDEFNRTSCLTPRSGTTSLDGETATTVHANKWSVTFNELQSILRGLDPFHVLSWYRDAQPKFPELEKMLEAEIFALLIDVRDDLLFSALLANVIHRRSISYYDSGWTSVKRDIGCRLVRAYLKKYPDAAGGHPPPIKDDWMDWSNFQGLWYK